MTETSAPIQTSHGADKAHDTKDFVQAARALNLTAHVTKNEKGSRSNLDRRTTPSRLCHQPQQGWPVEKTFGWALEPTQVLGIHTAVAIKERIMMYLPRKTNMLGGMFSQA